MDGRIIAFAGKGGSGKTTLTSLVLRQLIRQGVRPILAVDADPNATLALTLGIKEGQTISDLRDRMGEAAQNPASIPKTRLMDQYLAEILEEHEGFDLLTMGRPEGPSCYCYVNGLLRRYLSLLRKSYAYVLVDCEAGMEYLSRLIVDDVEALVLVAEATHVGLTTVRRIAELADSLAIQVHRRILALNKTPEAAVPELAAKIASQLPNVEAVVAVPQDADLAGRCSRGEAIDDEAGPGARAAVVEIAERCTGATASAGEKDRRS